MNKSQYLICIFFFASFTEISYLNEQKHSTNIMDKFTAPIKGDYITPLVFGINHKDSILKSAPPPLYYQIMAANFSYVGDYKKSLEY